MRKMALHHQTLFGVQAVQLLMSAMIEHFRFVTRERLPIRIDLEKGLFILRIKLDPLP